VLLPRRFIETGRTLQRLIEPHLPQVFTIRLVASEYAIGRSNRGHIDTLGLDAQAAPVFIEYKPAHATSLIVQGHFYLDWLLDQLAEVHLLVEAAAQSCVNNVLLRRGPPFSATKRSAVSLDPR